ncbi:MAG: hypothetical protein ACE5HE_10410 [Phycisphaerae bacterium]
MHIERRALAPRGWAAAPPLCAVALCTAIATWGEPRSSTDGVTTIADPPSDAVVRRTDLGADGPVDPQLHALVDLQSITVGAWAPDDPAADLFSGVFDVDGQFVRLDLVVKGLINPPGSVDPFAFNPFRYGDHPIYGFVEIDMDAYVYTGGELVAPDYRYLGNVARWGGQPPREEFSDRIARGGEDFDGDFLTPPFIERHGEEFHLALLGGGFGLSDINELAGNGDLVFDSDETWQITGSFFHRAHGFEPFSLADGGSFPGEYAPESELQFRHDSLEDVTYLSLVFPLTNIGAGLMTGDPPEPLNADPSDQFSVLEALDDLQSSALFLNMYPSGLPEEDIILGWEDRDPNEHLNPAEWSMTALLGTSYTEPDAAGALYVWTDIMPDVAVGDYDGDGEYDDDDRASILQFIKEEDGSDGSVDGRVVIQGFAWDFSIYDTDYNGVVDERDYQFMTSAVPGAGGSLWRTEHNVVHLSFSSDIGAPAPGEILIQSMLSGGLFGPDISSGFEFRIELDTDGKPRVLEIVDESPPDLVHREWYAIRSLGGWTNGAEFSVEYVVQVGDSDNDGRVLNLDVGLINAAIPDLDADEEDRRDIDGDGTVLNADVSTANAHLPSLAVPRPGGH